MIGVLTFLSLAESLGNEITLRFWHEVAIVPEGGAHFESINCSGG